MFVSRSHVEGRSCLFEEETLEIDGSKRGDVNTRETSNPDKIGISLIILLELERR